MGRLREPGIPWRNCRTINYWCTAVTLGMEMWRWTTPTRLAQVWPALCSVCIVYESPCTCTVVYCEVLVLWPQYFSLQQTTVPLVVGSSKSYVYLYLFGESESHHSVSIHLMDSVVHWNPPAHFSWHTQWWLVVGHNDVYSVAPCSIFSDTIYFILPSNLLFVARHRKL